MNGKGRPDHKGRRRQRQGLEGGQEEPPRSGHELRRTQPPLKGTALGAPLSSRGDLHTSGQEGYGRDFRTLGAVGARLRPQLRMSRPLRRKGGAGRCGIGSSRVGDPSEIKAYTPVNGQGRLPCYLNRLPHPFSTQLHLDDEILPCAREDEKATLQKYNARAAAAPPATGYYYYSLDYYRILFSSAQGGARSRGGGRAEIRLG